MNSIVLVDEAGVIVQTWLKANMADVVAERGGNEDNLHEVASNIGNGCYLEGGAFVSPEAVAHGSI